MATHDPLAQLIEALLQQLGVVVELLRRIDRVTGIEVHPEGPPVDALDQLAVVVWRVRHGPTHHLKTEPRALGLHRVDDLAGVFHCGVKEPLAEIIGVRPEPGGGVERARDIDAAQSPDFLRQRQPIRYRLQVLFPLLWIAIEQVHPAANLRYHNIVLRECS